MSSHQLTRNIVLASLVFVLVILVVVVSIIARIRSSNSIVEVTPTVTMVPLAEQDITTVSIPSVFPTITPEPWLTAQSDNIIFSYPKGWIIEKSANRETEVVVIKPPTAIKNNYPSVSIHTAPIAINTQLSTRVDTYGRLGLSQSRVIIIDKSAYLFVGTSERKNENDTNESYYHGSYLFESDGYAVTVEYIYPGKTENKEWERVVGDIISSLEFKQ